MKSAATYETVAGGGLKQVRVWLRVPSEDGLGGAAWPKTPLAGVLGILPHPARQFMGRINS